MILNMFLTMTNEMNKSSFMKKVNKLEPRPLFEDFNLKRYNDFGIK